MSNSSNLQPTNKRYLKVNENWVPSSQQLKTNVDESAKSVSKKEKKNK
ncbi:MAG: hypothetical protein HFJ59_01230 [Clostridia bacterium]|nr:hypothetical protein [Clostridia bacterium]